MKSPQGYIPLIGDWLGYADNEAMHLFNAKSRESCKIVLTNSNRIYRKNPPIFGLMNDLVGVLTFLKMGDKDQVINIEIWDINKKQKVNTISLHIVTGFSNDHIDPIIFNIYNSSRIGIKINRSEFYLIDTLTGKFSPFKLFCDYPLILSEDRVAIIERLSTYSSKENPVKIYKIDFSHDNPTVILENTLNIQIKDSNRVSGGSCIIDGKISPDKKYLSLITFENILLIYKLENKKFNQILEVEDVGRADWQFPNKLIYSNSRYDKLTQLLLDNNIHINLYISHF